MQCLSLYQGHHLLSFLGEWPFLLVCTHMQLHNAGLVETLQTLLREGKKPGNTLLATFYRGLIPGALSKTLYCLCFSYLHRTLFRLMNHRKKRAVPLYKKYLSLNALKQFLHLEKEAEFRFHLQRRQKMELSQDDVLQRAKRFAAFALCFLLFRPVSDMTQNFDVLLLAQQQLSSSSSSSLSSASPSSSLDSNERREKKGRTNLRLSAKKNASGLLQNAKIVLYNVVISAVASFVSYPFLTLATRAIAPNEAAQQPLISPKTVTKWTTGLQMLKMFLMMIVQRQISLSQAKDMFYMSLEQQKQLQQKQKRATPSASPSPLLALVKKLYSGFLPRLFYTLLQSGFDAIMALMLLRVASKIYDVIQHQRHEEKDEKDEEEERMKRRRIFYQFIRAIFIGCIVKHVVAYPFNVISTRKRLLNTTASVSLFSLFRGWMFIAVVKYFFVLLVRPKVEQKWMLLWSHQQTDDEKEEKEEKGKEKKHDDAAEETLDEGQDYVGEEEYEDLGSWLL
ncbi:hypothetical protein QOT17_018771 [Balamuthia mandrillaris]